MTQKLPDRKQILTLQKKIAEKSCTRSFEQLYTPFYPFLHFFAYRIIRSETLAEEIVSDVFVKLWKNRAQMSAINNLRVFLYVAVKNTSLNYLEREKQGKICWLEEFSRESIPAATSENPFHQLAVKELREHLKQQVEALPPRCRVIYKLIKEDGLKYTEAARILNLSVKTIENQMGLALKRIALGLK